MSFIDPNRTYEWLYISVRSAVRDRSASIFLFSLGVVKIFGLQLGIRALIEVS